MHFLPHDFVITVKLSNDCLCDLKGMLLNKQLVVYDLMIMIIFIAAVECVIMVPNVDCSKHSL